MKISLNSQFLKGPYGGGMQFANFMKDFLENQGITVVNNLKDEDIDIILHINPFPHLTPDASAYSYIDAWEYKKNQPRTTIIERVNECDERKGTNYMNSLLAKAGEKSDFVVYIASWLQPLVLKAGLPEDKPWRVILNGADERNFNIIGKEFWNGQGKMKIITHHWSDNPNKGLDTYLKLDELLFDQKYCELFEFTYIGRIDASKFKNTKILPPLSGKDLGDELSKHHLYITASKNEPGGMHHIEGGLSGLPFLYINSGALPEYCSNFGLEFNSENLSLKLLEMRDRYKEFVEKIKSYNNTAEKMGEEYLKLFKELYAKNS